MNQNNIHEGRAAAAGKGEAAWETSENLGATENMFTINTE